jgi:hypothetical protein
MPTASKSEDTAPPNRWFKKRVIARDSGIDQRVFLFPVRIIFGLHFIRLRCQGTAHSLSNRSASQAVANKARAKPHKSAVTEPWKHFRLP